MQIRRELRLTRNDRGAHQMRSAALAFPCGGDETLVIRGGPRRENNEAPWPPPRLCRSRDRPGSGDGRGA